ncbi:PKD domain-containing protein [bacterium]|nr:PKD domain-containing protein [bacterium]
MAGWNEKYSGIIAGTIAAGMLLSLMGCGSTTPSAQVPGPDSRQTARVMSLDEALAEVDALSTPEGVDPQRFQLLQDELARVLREQGSQRFVSEAPQSQGSAVNDLMITHNPDGSADLAWTYRNQGDGDLNSEVNIADLTPIGIHLGKSGASPDWNKARNTDNDGNNEVNISDITPIGSNFLRKVQGYWIQRAVNVDSAWNLVSQVEFSTSAINSGTSARDFVFHINVPADGQFYRVAPYDGGNIGIPSNAVQAQSLSLPGRPNNPAATQGSLLEQVDLSWDPVADAEYYEIQRRTGTLGSFEPLAETTDNGTSYSDTDVVTGQHYFYIVRGWQGDKKTDYSIQFEGWPLDLPTVPQNLAASDGTSPDHVSVSWEASSGADEYVLYHSLEQDGTYTELLHTTELSYDDTAAALESLNWYYVTAVNAAGETNQSNKDSGYRDGAVPVIDSVSPLTGLTGEAIQMTALTSGASINAWSWDFGGGATPGTSTDESPMITLGDPGVYECSLTVDGNLDSDTFNFQLTVTSDEWVHTFGTAVNDKGFDVRYDAAGNVYVIGSVGLPVVAKFNNAGELLWSRYYETDVNVLEVSGDVSAAGDVVVVVGSDGDFNNNTPGMLCFKLNTDGDLQFAHVADHGSQFITCHYPKVVIDANGNILVTYSMWDLTGTSLDARIVAYRLNSDGSQNWLGFYTDHDGDFGHSGTFVDGVAVDSAGNFYLTGPEFFLTKLDTSGNVAWTKGWETGAHDHPYCLMIDDSDNLIVSGASAAETQYQPMLVKFQTDGNVLWQKSYSAPNGQSGHIEQLRVDESGNFYGVCPFAATGDIAIASNLYTMDSNGELIDAWQLPNTGSHKMFSLDVANGKICITGYAPDANVALEPFAATVVDHSGTISDLTTTKEISGPLILQPEPPGNLKEFTGTLDIGQGGQDILVMNLRIENLP